MGLEYLAVPHRARSPCRRRSSAPSRGATRRSRRRTSSGTCSRSRSTSSATRCTPSRRSRRACATCGRPRAAGCASSRPTRAAYPEIKLNYLSTDGRPQGGRGRHALHAAHHGGQGAGEVRAGGVQARACRSRPTRSWKERRASSARPSSTRSAPAGWAATRWRWWTTRLRVRGIDGLRVVDASIMPRITSGQHQRPDLRHRGEGRAGDLEIPQFRPDVTPDNGE